MIPRWCLGLFKFVFALRSGIRYRNLRQLTILSTGYLGSTMAYTEAHNTQDELKNFVLQRSEHRIPCDAFHLSSGQSKNHSHSYGLSMLLNVW